MSPLRKQTGTDHDFSGLRKEYSMKLAIKCVPFVEQVMLLAMLPDVAGIDPCASLILGIPP